MRPNHSKKSKGFTLVETLVIATTCVLLLTLTLPGILHARQQARQESCKNNLKQLGLAMHNYHDVFNTFPPAWCTNHFDANSKAAFGWQSFLLPYVEQANLYNHIDLNQPDWTSDVSQAEECRERGAGSDCHQVVLVPPGFHWRKEPDSVTNTAHRTIPETLGQTCCHDGSKQVESNTGQEVLIHRLNRTASSL